MKSFYFILLIVTFFTCNQKSKKTAYSESVSQSFQDKLSDAAISLTKDEVTYDPSYISIPYPNGDVPKNKGVCTDVIIRAYRKLNIDLQKEVHEDMNTHFSSYPNLEKWGLKKTDTNIDHRRVPNLEIFFARKGEKLAVSENPSNYKAGELVTWMINDKLPHIGIITNKRSLDGKRPMIVHNVGAGQVLEDCLFNYTIVGHYKYGK